MPQPVLVAFCNDLVEDRLTGLVTVHKLIEKIGVSLSFEPGAEGEPATVTLTPANAGSGARPDMYAFSVWMRTEDDGEGQEFVHQFRWVAPDGTVTPASPEKPFSFPEPEKNLRRFSLRCFGIPPIAHSGVCAVESAVRRVDGTEWATSRYHYNLAVKLPEGIEKITGVEILHPQPSEPTKSE